MAKKLTIFDREKLLKARERGLTDSEIKAQFGITDDRTLRRHLKLAEQEQEAKVVKTEILRQALSDHLAELRQLIENWKAGIGIQPVTILPSVMANPMEFLHSNRLFDCLKSHLPFPTLWRDYNQWEAKYKSYIVNCEQLRKEIEKEATEKLGLPFADDISKLSHLTSRLMNWILRGVEYKLQRWDEKEFEFRWKYYKVEIDKQPAEVKQVFVYPAGETLLEIFGKHEVNNEFYEKRCRELLYFCLKSGTAASLLTLFDDLRYLQTKIHNSLEEILLRRDYILYTCDLCPGKPRLVR
jgi:hypothetical protein